MAASNAVQQLADRLGQSWPAIAAAAEASAKRLEALTGGLSSYTTEDTSIVVFGSLARGEVTSGSDLDWILLVDGFADPEHMTAALAIDKYIDEAEWKGPGAEATFGGLVSSHDLVHLIGGSDDTNANLTHRMLLLLESTAVGRSDARSRVVNNVLSRYILEDFGWMHSRNPSNVPRFLHNDIVRYWRTLAVDFAYKRRTRRGRGWGLRTAKLRLSRKLTYASGLIMCFSCAERSIPSPDGTPLSRELAARAVVSQLAEYVALTPLEIVAGFFLGRQALHSAAVQLFSAYDAFLGMLNNDGDRERLDRLTQSEIATDATYERVRGLGQSFQEALNKVFFNPIDAPELFELTKTYGVF